MEQKRKLPIKINLLKTEPRRNRKVKPEIVHEEHNSIVSSFVIAIEPKMQNMISFQIKKTEAISSSADRRIVGYDYRGKGYGRAILEKAEKVAKEHGAKKFVFEGWKSSTMRLLLNNKYRIVNREEIKNAFGSDKLIFPTHPGEDVQVLLPNGKRESIYQKKDGKQILLIVEKEL